MDWTRGRRCGASRRGSPSGARPWCIALLLVTAPLISCESGSTSGLPPIQTTGSVGHTFRTIETPERSREYSNQTQGRLQARSYIWQPWFITAETGGTVAYENTVGGEAAKGDSLIASGNASLGILPLSRYPVTLSYAHTDSRTEGNFSNDFVSDRANATIQGLFSNTFRTGARASYERVDEEDAGIQEFRSAGLDVLQILDKSRISLALSHVDEKTSSDSTEAGNERESDDIATLRHIYTPTERLRTDSTATVIYDQDETASRDETGFLTQGTSTAQWRPEDRSFTVNGALRAFKETREFDAKGAGGGESDALTTSGTVGLNYPIVPRLTTNLGLSGTYQARDNSAGGGAAASSGEDRETIEGRLIGSANYLSLPTPVATFDWSWNASALAEPAYREERGQASGGGGQEGFEFSGSLALGHAASRGVDVPALGPSQFRVSQRGRVIRTREDETIPNLSHTASLTYSAAEDGTTTLIRLSGSDTRDLAGDTQSEFSLGQLQLNRQSAIDIESGWRGGLTAQISRRKSKGQDEDVTVTANGNLGYFVRRIFGVRNLDFNSDLVVRAFGLEDAIEDEDDRQLGKKDIRAEWTNRLDYRIGRITAGLEAEVFYSDRSAGESGFGSVVIFRIRRDFGGVL